MIDGMTNWENTSSDGDRFSGQSVHGRVSKSLKSFDNYLEKKAKRAKAKMEVAAKKAASVKIVSSKEATSIYSNTP